MFGIKAESLDYLLALASRGNPPATQQMVLREIKCRLNAMADL